jgi:predicted nucleic acid-binding protein
MEMDTLIFIDTNILLDFYRIRGRDASLSILSHIDKTHDRIITSSQVEMEFKRNRQQVILESYKEFNSPNWQNTSLPVFLAQAKQSHALLKSRKDVDRYVKTLRNRMGKILRNPQRMDVVYQTAQRLFRSRSPLNLSRDKAIRLMIRRRAWKRFILGYPPRKPRDTSLGDAVNWEWVVECAIDTGKHVVLVTRDSDFGVSLDAEPILNEWLRQEFKERVGAKRKLMLTQRLTDGLKEAAIKVTKKEVETERKFLNERHNLIESMRRIAKYQQQFTTNLSTAVAPLLAQVAGPRWWYGIPDQGESEKDEN